MTHVNNIFAGLKEDLHIDTSRVEAGMGGAGHWGGFALAVQNKIECPLRAPTYGLEITLVEFREHNYSRGRLWDGNGNCNILAWNSAETATKKPYKKHHRMPMPLEEASL